MTEFWIMSNFLRQLSCENAEIHQLCKAVAAKYLENEKNDLRANNVREENIALQIDVGNLKQLHQSVAEVIEAQSASEALLDEYYDEQLKMAYDIDQQEKIFRYDEIKADLETQESINMYEELYNRRVEMANKMEERQIVKKYRHKEQEFTATENDYLKLEENLKAIKAETDQVQATIQETILRLVKGWKEQEQTPTPLSGFMEKKQIIKTIEEKSPDRNLTVKKPGLSSRLSMKFKSGKIPSAIVAPRMQPLNQSKGLDRLLQEAEILRKSMQITPDEKPRDAKPSIISKESKKEKSRKKVTFDLITPDEAPLSKDESDICAEIVIPHLDEAKEKPPITNEKCVILEDVVIRPPGAPLPIKIRKDEDSRKVDKPEAVAKRKIDQDKVFLCPSPEKKQRLECDTKTVESPGNVGDPKSFMDMFIDFSKDSTLEISSILTPNEVTAPCMTDKEKPDSKEVVVIDGRKQKMSFEGFEEFFASLNNAGSEGNNNEFERDGNSFDFFDTNDNTRDDANGDDDNFSFKF